MLSCIYMVLFLFWSYKMNLAIVPEYGIDWKRIESNETTEPIIMGATDTVFDSDPLMSLGVYPIDLSSVYYIKMRIGSYCIIEEEIQHE